MSLVVNIIRQFFWISTLILGIILSSCAKIGSPSGGLKDSIPPVPLFFLPPNYSTQFEAKKITVTFDEFVDLKDIRSELVVSPPFSEQPDVSVRDKSIVIKFADTLMPDITYNFNFGNAVVDYHEGNPYTDFQYVFSTTSYIDSFSITGLLRNSFDHTLSKDPFWIMIYDQLYDSIPLKEIPLYIGKTDKEGLFTINNIRPGTYKVFALKDFNNNKLYDLPSESIAFADTFIVLNPDIFIDIVDTISPVIPLDTIELDSITRSDSLFISDSMSLDSILDTRHQIFQKFYAAHINLYYFDDEVFNPYMVSSERKDRKKLDFIFNEPLPDTLDLKILDCDSLNKVLRYESSISADTVFYWIIDSNYIKKDTLHVVVNYPALDTLNQLITRSDTVKLIYKPSKKSGNPNPRQNSRKKEETDTGTVKIDFLPLNLNVANNRNLDYNQSIKINVYTPIKEFSKEGIKLEKAINDSTFSPVKFELESDSINLHFIRLINGWEFDSKYQLIIDSACITDIYGVFNDYLKIPFSIPEEESYGAIALNFLNVEVPLVGELFTDKEKIVRKFKVAEDGIMEQLYLQPGNYNVKIVYDHNNNGKWDTGKYLEHIQPEDVRFYEKPIVVKTNFTTEEEWDVSLNHAE